jgi:dTMP kinase
VARLVEWLRSQGLSVVACRDPGGTPLGDRLRHLLLERDQIELATRAEMFLYMSSRSQLVETVIQPAIESGAIVVCDRYLLANVVYQGYAGGLSVEELWRVGEIATSGVMPDLTILLNLDPALARRRIGKPRDRMEDKPLDFHERVHEGYLSAVADYRWPITVIDAAAPVETMESRIQSEVRGALVGHRFA